MGRESMIDIAARALAGESCYALANGAPGHIKEMAQSEMETCRQRARTVMEAIRKPNNAMLKAACAAMSPGKRPTQKRVSCKAKHGIRYRAMIDAALEGE